jgi:gluconate 2-dehydrogenase gamma chain
MKRRDVLKTALFSTGFGAGAALSGQSLPRPHHLPANAAAAAAAQAGQAENWQPLLFDPHQNKTVVALSDRIIPATDTPGAKAVNVNAYIDLVLNDGEPEPRNTFLQGLGWLDGYAIREHGVPFVECTEARQVALLESLDESPFPGLTAGADFFAQAKRLTIEGYYTTKIGIDELNKGGVPETYGCTHESHG